jgi:hypothetical protein
LQVKDMQRRDRAPAAAEGTLRFSVNVLVEPLHELSDAQVEILPDLVWRASADSLETVRVEGREVFVR